MNNNAKTSILWSIFFIVAIVLPLSAFGQTAPSFTSFTLFTPPPGDQSVRFLQWIFGVVPGVLSGYGNQVMGILFSVFNAAGVAILGAFVVISIYHGVVDLAVKGDFMQGGQDKKSIYTIIRIVIATVLIVPAKNTGYSLAQSGVMWIVLQGIGLADQVNNKLYNYYAVGGSTFTMAAPTFKDVGPLILPMEKMLASEVCTYKIQDIQTAQAKAAAAVGGNSNVLPYASMNNLQDIGFQVNANARVATFGKITSTDATNPTGQCGSVSWSIPSSTVMQQRFTTGHTYTQNGSGTYFVDGKAVGDWNTFRNSEYYPAYTNQASQAMDSNTIVSYEQAATTQAATSLMPVAQQIVNTGGDPTQLNNLAPSIGSALAQAALTYTTIIDPVRNASGSSMSKQMATMLQSYANQGWIYTPMMIYTTAFRQSTKIDVSSFAPTATAPSTAAAKPGDAFSTLSDSDRASVTSLVQNVMQGGYNNIASAYMSQLNANNNGQAINFQSFLTSSNASTNKTDQYTGYVTGALGGIQTALNAINQAPQAVASGASYALGAINSTTAWINKETGKNFSSSQLGTDKIQSVQDTLNNYKGTLGGLGGASDMINGMLNQAIGDVPALKNNAIAGGFNDQLANLTVRIGPAGPILALLITSIIGENITTLENYVNQVFSGDTANMPDAMGMAMNLGGRMTESSLESVFTAGEIAMIITGVAKLTEAAGEAAGGAISSALGSIPVLGGLASGVGSAISKATSMASSVIAMSTQTAVLFYLGFAFIFFTGGLMLYYFLPMVPILNFLLVVATWFSMVVVSMLGAPVFCINLIRHDPQGSMLGKGERYMIDLLRTALIPSIVTLGAVAFIILFNVVFILITTIVASFIPLITQAYASVYLISVVLGVTLIGFAMLTIWAADSLATACMSTAVNTMGSMMGEALQHIHGQAASREMGEAVKGTGGQLGGTFGQQGATGQMVQGAGKMLEGGGKKEKKE